MIRRFGVLAFILLSLSGVARAQDDSSRRDISVHDFRGYLKQLTIFQFARSIDTVVTLGELHNRLGLSVSIGSRLELHAEARTRLYYGEGVRYVSDASQLVGSSNESIMWAHNRSLILHTMLDRLYLDETDGDLSVRAGIQRLNWGINTIWTPNDIFNSYNVFDFDYEEGPGAEAVRARYTIEPGLSVEGAFENRAWRDMTAAVRAMWNVGGYDLQALAGAFRGSPVAGVGFAGNIGDAGWKGEASYFGASSGHTSAVTASMTFDHVIGGYFLTLSGLYCSDVPASAASGGELFDATRTARQLMPFRYTGYLSASKAFTPLFTATAAVLYSPTNGSLILFPSIAYSLAENVDADLTLESFFNNATGPYAAAANAFFLRLRWSF
ncbi:MAG: hypothetical protein JSS75_12775 [Bacteroidetes bacterium]|nr:hypothetical protein [Bacteroidota bacterium]